jgi:hypothetical protein
MECERMSGTRWRPVANQYWQPVIAERDDLPRDYNPDVQRVPCGVVRDTHLGDIAKLRGFETILEGTLIRALPRLIQTPSECDR